VEPVSNCTSDAEDPLGQPNTVEVEVRDGVAVLTLCGELDLWMADLVRLRFDDLDGDVEVDCAGLTFMDAAGIRLLLEMDRNCRARGAKLVVVSPPRCVTRLLALVQLDGAFDVRSKVPGW